MERESDKPIGKRISRRNRPAGFSFGSSHISESTATEGGGMVDINAHVATAAVRPVAVIPPPQPVNSPEVAPPTMEEFSPSGRMEQVRRRAGAYAKEYRLGLLHRLLMRRVPMDEIAEQLGISLSQVYRDREELSTKLRAEARGLDINELIGESTAFYDEAAAMAMRAASSAEIPIPIRLAAIRTGLAARNDKHRFYETAGVYNVLQFRRAADGSGVSDVRQLMMHAERILAGGSDDFSTPANTGDTEEIEL
jgi:hypothetical protein